MSDGNEELLRAVKKAQDDEQRANGELMARVEELLALVERNRHRTLLSASFMFAIAIVAAVLLITAIWPGID